MKIYCVMLVLTFGLAILPRLVPSPILPTSEAPVAKADIVGGHPEDRAKTDEERAPVIEMKPVNPYAVEKLREQPERLPQIQAEKIAAPVAEVRRQIYYPPDCPTDVVVKVGDVLVLEPFADAKDMDIQLAGWTHSGPLNYLRNTRGKVFFHAEKEGRVRFVLVLTDRGSPVKDKLVLYTVTVNEGELVSRRPDAEG